MKNVVAPRIGYVILNPLLQTNNQLTGVVEQFKQDMECMGSSVVEVESGLVSLGASGTPKMKSMMLKMQQAYSLISPDVRFGTYADQADGQMQVGGGGRRLLSTATGRRLLSTGGGLADINSLLANSLLVSTTDHTHRGVIKAHV